MIQLYSTLEEPVPDTTKVHSKECKGCKLLLHPREVATFATTSSTAFCCREVCLHWVAVFFGWCDRPCTSLWPGWCARSSLRRCSVSGRGRSDLRCVRASKLLAGIFSHQCQGCPLQKCYTYEQTNNTQLFTLSDGDQERLYRTVVTCMQLVIPMPKLALCILRGAYEQGHAKD